MRRTPITEPRCSSRWLDHEPGVPEADGMQTPRTAIRALFARRVPGVGLAALPQAEFQEGHF